MPLSRGHWRLILDDRGKDSGNSAVPYGDNSTFAPYCPHTLPILAPPFGKTEPPASPSPSPEPVPYPPPLPSEKKIFKGEEGDRARALTRTGCRGDGAGVTGGRVWGKYGGCMGKMRKSDPVTPQHAPDSTPQIPLRSDPAGCMIRGDVRNASPLTREPG